MKLRALLAAIILCATGITSLNAQTIDSLYAALKQVKEKDQTHLYNEIALAYRYINPDSSVHYGHLARKRSQKRKEHEAYQQALTNICIGYYAKGQYDTSLSYVEAFFKTEPKNPTERSVVLNLKGLCLLRKGENKGAIDAFYASLAEADEVGDFDLRIKPLTNIGLVYMELQQMNQAITQFLKALNLLEAHENLGVRNIILSDLAACYGAINELDSARYFAEASLELALKIQNPASAANAYNILSTYFQHVNKLDSAALMLLKAQPYREMQADPYLQVADAINLAQIYIKQKDYASAKAIAESAQHIADSLGVKSKKADLLLLNAQIAKAENRWQDAATYYALWGEEKDSIYTEANSNALAELQVRYNVAQQEKTNIELKAAQQEEARKNDEKNLIILLILAVFAGTTIISVLLFKRKKERDRIHLERLEIDNRQKIFKAWIEGESKERARLAKELHDGLGQLLVTAKMSLDSLESEDENIQHSTQLLHNSIDELRHISHDLMPATLMRLGLIPALRDLKRQIEKASTIECDWQLIDEVETDEERKHAIYRIVQEFLNNALRHGEPSKLQLILENKEQNGIHIFLRDNGKGFDTSKISVNSGMGWNSIFLRINLYKGTYNLTSSPGKGTELSIYLPLRSSK